MPPILPFRLPRSLAQRRISLALGALLVVCVLGVTCAKLGPLALLYRLGVSQPYPLANTMSLQSISMVSADEGWAVGHISGSPNTLLMRYHQGQWTILPKPAGLDDTAEFSAISMVTATDGWALVAAPIWLDSRHRGFRPGSLLLRYDGLGWTIASDLFPMGSGTFDPSALLMIAANDGWVTGEDKTLHYDGTAWREVTALSDQRLGGGSAISATSPNDVWIARFTGEIVHFDGKTWTAQRITQPFGQQLPGSILLSGITMISPTEGFAAGGFDNSSSGVVLRYFGGQWSVQSIVGQYLYSVSMHSATEGWAVGASGGIYQYVGGRWTETASPVTHPLYSVAVVSPDHVWAVGIGGALLRYNGSRWEQETHVVWSKAAQDAWK